MVFVKNENRIQNLTYLKFVLKTKKKKSFSSLSLSLNMAFGPSLSHRPAFPQAFHLAA
jgi:hypothetical protein